MSAECERVQQRCDELERQLQQAEQKAAYYQKLTEQAGIARLRETETLSLLLAEYKQAEEQLRFQAELLEQMQDTVVATDFDGRITYLNESACRTLQKERTELLGTTSLIFGEDRERSATQQEILQRTLADGSWHGTVINYAADGTELIFDTRTWLTRNAEGTPAGIVGVSTNVTARKQAEEEVNLILRTVHDGFSLIDMQGRFLYVNDTYCRMLGYCREEFLSFTITDINADYHSPDEALQRIERLKDTGSDLFESRLRRKDGRMVDVEVSATYMNISGGRMLAFVRDITERKRAEAAINNARAELEARVEELSILSQITQTVATAVDLQSILEVVADVMTCLFKAHETVITLLDERHTALTVTTHVVSSSAVFPTDVETENLVGFQVPFVTTPTVSRLIETRQSTVVPHAQTARQTRAFHEILRIHGTQCLMNIPLQSRSEVIGMITVGTNDQDREFTPEEVTLAETIAGQVAGAIENARLFEQEQYQRQVAESLREVALVLNSSLDQETVLVKILEQLHRVLRYDSAGIFLQDQQSLTLFAAVSLAKQFIGHSIPLSGTNPVAQAYRQHQPRVIPDVSAEPSWETWPGGEQIQSWIGVPLLIGEHALGVLTMDSLIKGTYSEADACILQIFANQAALAIHNARLFADARKARQEAEVANNAKSELLDRVSHELRTPLHSIMGHVYLMQVADPTAKQRVSLEKIQTASNDLLRLITAMLDFSSIETGILELELRPFRLDELLNALFQQRQSPAYAKKIDMRFDIHQHVPVSLVGDAHQLEQVLTQLLDNAIKFTDSGEIVIQVEPDKPGAMEASRFFLRFSVSDTGVGIPSEKLPELFALFHQADGSRTRTYGGTGLGLALCKRLVEVMDGQIGVVSHPGQGSVFFFTVPFTRSTDIPDTEPIRSGAFSFQVRTGQKAISERHIESNSEGREADTSLDMTEAMPVFQRLANLLQEHDMESLDYVDLLTESMRGANVDVELQDIQRCLTCYEFEEAIEVLVKMASRLGISLEVG